MGTVNSFPLTTTVSQQLADLAALTPADGNVIVGDGTNFVTESGATARTSLGVGTGDSPQFTGVELGHATDTTITRVAAGRLAVEGVGLVKGPASAVAGNAASFSGTTGDLIQDSGKALPTGTIVGTSDSQTLTNKTLVAPALGAATGDSLALGGAILGSNVLGVTGAVGASGTIRAQNAAAIPAGGTAATGFLFSSTANFGLTFGSGAPTLSVAQGSVYLRSDGLPYYNTNGTTGWDALVGATASQTLTNKTLTTPVISSISNTGTLTLPNSTDTLVGRATTDTLSNKTFVAPVLGAATGTSLALGGATLGSNILAITGAVGASGAIRAQNAAAIGAGGIAGTGFLFSSTANFGLTYGSGSPTLSVAQGSLYLQSDGLPAYNTNGTTGWDTLVGRTATQTLTNKTLTSPAITTPTGIVKGDVGLGNVDNTSDATKNAAVATLTNKTLTAPVISTISNTGTLTLPTSTDTLVGRATTDTLTNKTLTAPVISTITNTGTLTLPTSTDTLVGRATTDTLTNKTISGSSNTLSNIANSSLATAGAYTIKGNTTGSSATPTDIDIALLTTKASPAAGDYVLLSDQAASGAFKKATISSIATAGSVSSIAGNTGAFTLSTGITNSGNDIRIDRGQVPGTTTNDNASSGNVGETLMSGAKGFSQSTVTMTIASPCVVTWTAHGLSTAMPVHFTTTGALPTGLSQNVNYYVIKIDADTFWLASSATNSIAGTKINTSGSQSGTHTALGSANLTSVTAACVNALQLTAGDWVVWASTAHDGDSATAMNVVVDEINSAELGFDQVPGTFGKVSGYDSTGAAIKPFTSASGFVVDEGPTRKSLSGSATIFLTSFAQFSGGKMRASGMLMARRAR